MDQPESPELELETEEPTEEPSEPQEPILVPRRVNGQTLMMTEAQADLWDAREVDFQRRLSQQGEELGRLRQARTDRPTPSSEDPNEANLRFFTDPNKALEERLRQEREQIATQMRQEYQLERDRERFWGQFYAENEHLKGRDRFVQAIVAQEFETLKDLPPDQCRKQLAEIINGISGVESKGNKRTLSTTPAMTERGGTPPSRTAPRPTQEAPKETISEELKRRSRERRQHAYNTPKE